MSTRLLLEGPSIEELLAQVRAEHGENARIVQAEKVRTGGFAGFFAKEKYEVAVEVEVEDDTLDILDTLDTAARDQHLRRASAALDILELVDEVEGESGDAGLAAIGFGLHAAYLVESKPQAVPAPVVEPVFETSVAAAHPARPVRPAVSDDDDSPLVSTSSESFARVLAALSRDVEEGHERVYAPASLPPADVMSPVTQSDASSPVTRTAASSPVTRTDEAAAADSALRDRAVFEALLAASTPESVSAPVVTRVRESKNAPTAVSPAVARLLAVGVPVSLVAELSFDLDLAHAAAAVAEGLPVASRPAAGAGQIVALVGEGRSAYAAARLLAGRLGLDADTVLLAAPSNLSLRVPATRHISSWREAVRRLAKLRASGSVVVVAVDSAVGKPGAQWAREVVEALEADTIWLLADASRKLAEVRTAVRTLGVLDALVVHNAGLTTTPGELLSLNLPVALVDEEPAAVPAWTRLLVSAAAMEDEEV